LHTSAKRYMFVNDTDTEPLKVPQNWGI
jgi:hypothetical protein